ncbi:hypothetical protein M2272_001534 [Mycobacterium frederiksbergense]|uniref:PEGA domain-containing protein n=1 Tax=Mycolicibacterium frederiksbergense TaxID=117567 RepID=A0ABT6KY47_9MYCO|nr:hypothetical protein [Mycolicibacterium frederiksbergense]MDH6194905.1 hypothetical protein [Mycolicibacterium frederiksbergense]
MTRTSRRQRLRTVASMPLAMLAAALVSGCSANVIATGTTTSSPTTATTTTASPTPSPTRFVLLDLNIANSTVTPTNTELQATAGQPIVVRVRTDEYAELVVGSAPELRFGIDPRMIAPQVLQFSVDAPGMVNAELLRQSGCPNRCEHIPGQDTTVAVIDVHPAPAQPAPEAVNASPSRVPCELLTPALAREFAGPDAQLQPAENSECSYTGTTRSVGVSVNPLPTNPDAPINHFSVIRPETRIPGVQYQAYWFPAASSVVVVKDGLLLGFRVSDNPMLPNAQVIQDRRAEDIRLADQIVPRVNSP